MKLKWKAITDKNVRHLWRCVDCKIKSWVSPDWYENNGTPMCPEHDEMMYCKTEVRVKNK